MAVCEILCVRGLCGKHGVPSCRIYEICRKENL